MSYTSNFLSELEKLNKKKKEKESNFSVSNNQELSLQNLIQRVTQPKISGGDDYTQSFLDELYRLEKEEKRTAIKTGISNAWDSFMEGHNERKQRDLEEYQTLLEKYQDKDLSTAAKRAALKVADDDYNRFLELQDKFDGNPSKVERKERGLQIFQAPEVWEGTAKAFDDGYDFGDVTKTILRGLGNTALTVGATAADVGVGAAKGILKTGENIADFMDFRIADVAEHFGNKEYAENLREMTNWNIVDKTFEGVDNFLDKGSVLGRTADSVTEGIGQAGAMLALGSLGGSALSATAITTGTGFISGAGAGETEALQSGATTEEARKYGLISGAADAVTELIFGGLGKGSNALGFGKGLTSADDMLAKNVSEKIANTIFKSATDTTKTIGKNVIQWGIKSGAEGFEEVLAGFVQAVGKKATYMSDADFWELVEDENLLEQFVVGALTSGIMQTGDMVRSNKAGRDFVSGLSKNEQSVIDKEFENRVKAEEQDGKKLTAREKNKLYDSILKDMEKGYISTDTIEEVLGGDTYKSYKDTIDSEDAQQSKYDSLQSEFDTLYKTKQGNMTGEQIDRLAELKEQLPELKKQLQEMQNNSQRNQLKTKLSEEVSALVAGDRLSESYSERLRRQNAFEADLSKYDEKQRVIVKSAIDSGILNNTRRTHELVDMVAKLSADKGVLFDFTNNAKLKESGFAIDGKTINGFVQDGKITINTQSAKYINSVVGHELTHILEGTDLYTELQNTLFEYAKRKGDYQGRLDMLTEMYKDVESADVNAELTADLVGDYLFADSDFINNLSTNNRNLFQKIYDEIKYLYKVATAGSKEARELEKVKKAFDKAYKNSKTADNGTKYSLSETTDGQFVAVVDNDILSNIESSSWDNTKKAEAKKAAADALKKFSDGIVVDGITRKVNRVSRREYTRSNYTESLYNTAPDVFADKMRAADVADDIVVAATNWMRDGGLNHPRNDNFVDFDHGKTLILSGNSKYIAEVVVGITDTGEAVLYDVVDMTPTTFDIKKDESPTTATTQNAIGDIQGDSSAENVAQETPVVKGKFSISDSNGRQLSNEQAEYFKDSKVRDENGNLMVLYHGTQNDFTVFDVSRSGENYEGGWSEYGEGIYMTPDKKTAEYYGDNAGWGREVKLMEVYANIKNLFNVNDPVDFDISDLTKKYDLTEFDERHIKQYGNRLVEFLQHHKESVRDYLTSKGFDGVWEKGLKGDVYQVVAYAENQVKNTNNAKPTADPDIRFSLSEDSKGREIPVETQERLQYSVIRDESGKIKPMYHGSPNGSITSFNAGTYFTDNKEYADRYQNTGASSISTGKVASNPKTYEVYLDIRNPFDLNDAEARNIYINEYIKGGNALGINPYMSDADYAKITAIDWTEGEDLRDFLLDNGYDYDGLVLDEGADGGYGDEVKYRGTSYMIFDPEQVVNVAPNVRFSLSNAVEESNDLMAIHNLHTNELLKQLEMGGMVYPSVAVTNPALISHDDFGEISAILRKDAIDPKKNKYNHLYSSDAYTPTFPSVSYEANRDVAESISNRIKEQFDKLPDYYQRSIRSFRDYTNLNDILNRWGGMQGLIDSFSDDHGMKQVYLAEKGENVPMEIERTETQLADHKKEQYQKVVDKIGADELASLNDKGNHSTLGEARIAWTKEHLDLLKDIYAEDWASDGHFSKEEALEIANEEKLFFWYKEAVGALEYMKNGGLTVVEKEDYNATNAKIDEKTKDSDYKKWLADLFAGIEGQSGIRNSKDTFLPSGKRRSFSQLHDPVTIDNVIKAMRKKEQTGQSAFGTGNFGGASVQEYGSIEEAKRNANMLGVIDEAEYKVIKQRIDDRLFDISSRYAAGKDIIDAKSAIAEAVAKNESKAGIARYLKQYDYVFKYTDEIADDIIELRDYVRSLPRPYFEAKPRRAVGFDEVAVFVIPYDADTKLKQELLNRGYSIAEYDPKVEGDRQRVVNQFEEYKFSLSNIGDTQKRYGNLAIKGEEVALETAPVRESAEQTVQEDVAPVQETAQKTPVMAQEPTPTTITIPPELDTLYSELDGMQAQLDDVTNRLLEMSEIEDFGDTFHQLSEEYTDLKEQIAEKQKQLDAVLADFAPMTDEDRAFEADRLASLDDADMPPEMDAPYPGEPTTTPEPFADRDIKEVGNRKVKAYMYENPEVKPFFQEAARVMLGDLGYTIRGERFFSEDAWNRQGNEIAWTGVKRQTTADIADLLDNWHYSYDQIEKGLKDIIEDNGKENNAVSKRIEFMLDDRLRNGYKDVWGEPMPADQGYITLLKEKQINEYSNEAFDRFMQTADQYAPPVEEDIAPVAQSNTNPNRVVTNNADNIKTFDAKQNKNVAEGQQAFWEEPANTESPKTTRKMLHQSIIDNTKKVFRVRGFDLDSVFKNAKDLATFATVDNTPQRVMEKALGYKEGGILADLTVNKVAQNETEGIKWLNSFTDRKNGLLAQISKQYNIKPGSKESAAAQMYAEGFYVDDKNNIIKYGDTELAKDFPNASVQKNIKGLARDQRIRKIYDDTLAAINESRTRNAYPEIPRLDNYFLHFRAMDDTFSRLGLPFNPNDIRAKDLPTDLNGVTADLKPGQPYFASAMHRKGKRTSFDLLGGLERYLTSAKNQIYHIDDIQTLRALRNYVADTYGQANGLEGLDELSEEAAQERIEQVYNSHLSTFAKFLNEEANVLAGKTALIDRGLEGIIGRRGITFLDTINKQVGSNMVGFNISSSLTNFLPVAQTFAKTNKADFVKAFGQTVANKVGSIFGRTDSFTDNSPVVIRRKGAERFYRTPYQKIGDTGYVFMSAVDDISTELIARTKYNELTRKGMDSKQAHYETDKWVSRLMGDRSLGQQPHLYNSKMLGLFTKFQLEVRNQLDSQFYDTIQEATVSNEHIQNGLARNAKTAAKVTSTFVQLAIAQHLFGKAFESVAGYNPAFDIISVLIKAFGFDDEEESEDTVLDNIGQAFFELMGDMPYVSTLTGGRIPISAALPIKELYSGKDQYGNEKSRWETLKEAAPYYLLPGGYGQLKKTHQGLSMFDDDLPIAGSYTDSGNLRFPVEDTLGNRVQAGIFGQWSSENARDYFDNERKPLEEKQIQEFIDIDIPIRDYWEYREGLSGLKTTEEKADYIDSLDLPIDKKNILINNILDRKEPVDLEEYGEYSSFAEFDFAEKNPEKYAFFKDNGISYSNYASADEDLKRTYTWAYNNPEKYDFLKNNGVSLEDYSGFDDETKEAYSWAYNNPEKHTVSKAISDDFMTYWQYRSDLSELDAKDENGETVSGLKKERVIDYINNLDIDYGQRIILFRSMYDSKADRAAYNQDIVDYLNSRDDISYSEMITILKELDFTVTADGTVYWD